MRRTHRVSLGLIALLAGTSSGQVCAPDAHWETFRDGSDEPNGNVLALAVFDDGDGAKLYAAGSFTSAGPADTANMARWNGSAWEALPGGPPGSIVLALAVQDHGGGDALYAGGWFTTVGDGATAANYVAMYDGASWDPLDGGVDIMGFGQPEVSALAAHDGALVAGGAFNLAGGNAAEFTASWDGAAWSALGATGPLGGEPFALYSDATLGLIAGGFFTTPAPYVARLNDADEWEGLGATNPPDGTVWAVARAPSGELVVGGDLTGGVRVLNEQANEWQTLGSGIDGSVRALVVFDDGNGPALYAGGLFSEAGGAPGNGVAKWNGSAWEALGDGLTGMPGVLEPGALAMTAFDAGDGAALTVAGSFGVAGDQDGAVARWVPACPVQNSCIADINTRNTNPGDPAYGEPDGTVDGADLSYFVENWLAQNNAVADINTRNTNPGDPGYGEPDGMVDGADLSYFVENWLGTLGVCP